MTPSHARLTGLDSSFLTVEGDNAHMHVGWAAVFGPPSDRGTPDFHALRDHVAARLARAPRCRQRLEAVPLGFDAPVWVDDEDFDIDHHVRRLPGRDFRAAADMALSQPLDRNRPLWELWIADELEDGVGVVGKAHHAMVDGIAAVELALLTVDTEPDAPAPPACEWEPAPRPSPLDLIADSARQQASHVLTIARSGAGIGFSLLGTAVDPRRAGQLAGRALSGARALGHALAPAPQIEALSGPASPERVLRGVQYSLAEIGAVRRALGGTVNDVVLAAVAGGMRRFAARHGEQDVRPKVMVPVNVRGGDDPADMGNRISFVFVDLPCDEPEPLGRLEAVKRTMRERKRAAEPETGDAIMGALEHAPRPVQGVAARLLASSRSFSFVVSNIPGPPQPLYMLGCPLVAVYPVVPIAEGHPVSVGFTTVQGEGFFGVHADGCALPDADRLAADIGSALDELVSIARRLDGSADGGRFARTAGPPDGADGRRDGAGSGLSGEDAASEAELDAAAAGIAPSRDGGASRNGGRVPAPI